MSVVNRGTNMKKRRNGLLIEGLCVYVFREVGGTACKIGWTNNVGKRFRVIQMGNPRDLEVAAVVMHRDAARIEGELHDHFEAQYIRGEWFNLTEADIAAIRRIPSIPAPIGPPAKSEPLYALPPEPPRITPRSLSGRGWREPSGRWDVIMDYTFGEAEAAVPYFDAYGGNRDEMPADLQQLFDEHERIIRRRQANVMGMPRGSC